MAAPAGPARRSAVRAPASAASGSCSSSRRGRASPRARGWPGRARAPRRRSLGAQAQTVVEVGRRERRVLQRAVLVAREGRGDLAAHLADEDAPPSGVRPAAGRGAGGRARRPASRCGCCGCWRGTWGAPGFGGGSPPQTPGAPALFPAFSRRRVARGGSSQAARRVWLSASSGTGGGAARGLRGLRRLAPRHPLDRGPRAGGRYMRARRISKRLHGRSSTL